MLCDENSVQPDWTEESRIPTTPRVSKSLTVCNISGPTSLSGCGALGLFAAMAEGQAGKQLAAISLRPWLVGIPPVVLEKELGEILSNPGV
jgi:hypothetical protein